MKDLQSHDLQITTTNLQNTASILIRKDSPTPDPERPPKYHLQNRFNYEPELFILVHSWNSF
jgi:hypothetical protein